MKFKIALLLMLITNMVYAQSTEYYRMEAAFLYHFTKYMHWDELDTQKEFVILILGNSEIVEELQVVAELRKVVSGKKIVIKKIDSETEIQPAEMLIITEESEFGNKYLIEKCNKFHIPIISQNMELMNKGAAISFIAKESKLYFKINKEILEKLGVQVATELEKMAIK